MNTYNTFLDNPDYIQQDLQRFLDVTSESLMQNVNTYLDPSKRVVLHVSPEPPKEESETKARIRFRTTTYIYIQNTYIIAKRMDL